MRPGRSTRERGSVTLVTAAILAVAVVITLGAVDVWRVVEARSQAQIAADAAALAAAHDLALGAVDPPASSAEMFAGYNGATLVSCDCAPGGMEATVEVELPVGRLALFPDDLSVDASARATAGGDTVIPSAP
ncbi:MAG: pilus assembly protein TadG-related protein [Actinobacteria bacterium]|nr:pilus assembly protein TadG-related protein [Actinomycetota bacterium]